MQEDRASLTATMVAFARSIATHDPELSRLCVDPQAEHLVPRLLSRWVQADRRHALRPLSLGMVDHLALRTAIIDEAVSAAARDGIRQFVLLGAGLDARAYRMDALRDAVVFEVDHPATQALKQRRVHSAQPRARAVRYASCDFQHTTLERALDDVGLARGERSCWVWEGVTMYLDETAVRSTMDSIARCTCAGSIVVNTYVTPQPLRNRLVTGLGKRALGWMSEPILSQFSPAEMAALWGERGFIVLADQHPFEQAARFGVVVSRPRIETPERVVVSRKR